MATTSDTATHTARKRHQCSWCAEPIEQGERYAKYRWWDWDDTGTVNLHLECYDAMTDFASDEGGWVEFEPGDNPRGCRCAFDAHCENPACVKRRRLEDEPDDGREGA